MVLNVVNAVNRTKMETLYVDTTSLSCMSIETPTLQTAQSTLLSL